MRSNSTKIVVLAFTLVVAFSLAGLGVARAINLGDIFKVGGIAFLVDRYNKPIDKFVNKALGERQAEARGATKVVPILSVGQGGYVGAAQVVGVPEQVKKVQAVAQLETSFHIGTKVRGKTLIPISTKKPTGSTLSKVPGVGVSAVVEFKI